MKKRILPIISIFTAIIMLTSCGKGSAINESVRAEIMQAYISGEMPIEYTSAKSVERALNSGDKIKGKIVQFDVREYHADSAIGINCWSGEHLNFISPNELNVSEGDIIIAYVTKEASKIIDSWKIPYEVIEIYSKAGYYENIPWNTSKEESKKELERLCTAGTPIEYIEDNNSLRGEITNFFNIENADGRLFFEYDENDGLESVAFSINFDENNKLTRNEFITKFTDKAYSGYGDYEVDFLKYLNVLNSVDWHLSETDINIFPFQNTCYITFKRK